MRISACLPSAASWPAASEPHVVLAGSRGPAGRRRSPRGPPQRPGYQRAQPRAARRGSVQRKALLGTHNPAAVWGSDRGPGLGGCSQVWDPKVPVLYQVERTRTGTSFSVRSVKAVQHGKPIFICQASFQQAQPSPLQHQFPMPAVPPPEELLDHEALIDQYLRDPNLQEMYRVGLNRIAAKEVPIEIKLVNPPILSQLQSKEPKQMFWVRARGHIGEGDMKMHCCVAAYISDYAFLGTALLPHQWQCNVHFMVSLDHSMWFHNPFRADHWMLYECESPWAGGSRGLVQGRLWRRDGILAVSCAQEGVIRVKSRVSESKL
ncbi:acyl-coenzyme A thioesterase 8 isoform X3 [Acinonyx jubatus]|uniref:Acyl-coenzyme A thioesterase 8 n=1 Tax=Acinonyx jubatus TaxID=32536 RepID=A0A6I9ZG45_ACIJB|nr:acyl-coenzyme A thioesterase 8 isoform X3 [Acinonyx jubatus]